jgi:hypothetical protein
MVDILVGILVLVLGIALCLIGYRLALILIPILGFFAGFWLGAAGIMSFFDDGFLATAAGWVIGFFVGLLFAILAYLFYYVAVVILGLSIGASAGSGLMALFGVDSTWIVAIVAAILAIVMAAAVIVLNLPKILLIVYTAFVGAVGIIAGLLLIFNSIDREQLGYGAAWAAIDDSWFWALVWIVLAAVGIGIQTTLSSGYIVETPDSPWEMRTTGRA